MFRRGLIVDLRDQPCSVGFRYLSEIRASPVISNVCFTPEGRYMHCTNGCLLRANSGQDAKRRPAEVSPKPISADHAAATTSSHRERQIRVAVITLPQRVLHLSA